MRDCMKCVIIASIWGSFYSMYYIVERGSIYVSNIIIHCSISIYDVIPSHLIEMTLKMMPIFIFQIVFGTSIYKHFCVASVYYFSRCNARTQWFLREIVRVFVFAILYNILIPIIVIGITAIHSSIHFDKEGVILFIYLVLLQSLWMFLVTVMMNLISIKVGSEKGFIITTGIQLTLIILLGIWDKLLPLRNIDSDQIIRNAFWLKWNPISHLIFNWHTSNNALVDKFIHNFEFSFCFCQSVFVFTILSSVVIIIGCIVVKYHDLIILNVETEQ